MGGDRLLWNAVATPLAAHYRVLVPDLRGHGWTPAPPGSQFTMAELEEDVLRLLDQKGLESVHLVGHSAGAFLALRIALDHPERVRSLILVSGAAYCDQHTRSVIDRWWSTYAEEGADGLALRLLKDLYYPDWVEAHMEFVDELYEDVNQRDFTAAVAWGRALKTFDELNSIAAIRRPTLIVQAMDDQVMDASHGRILRQTIPGSLIRIFAQTGHMIPVERPTGTRRGAFRARPARGIEGPRRGPANRQHDVYLPDGSAGYDERPGDSGPGGAGRGPRASTPGLAGARSDPRTWPYSPPQREPGRPGCGSGEGLLRLAGMNVPPDPTPASVETWLARFSPGSPPTGHAGAAVTIVLRSGAGTWRSC